MIYMSNFDDSRAVLANKKEIVVVDLSIDQMLFRLDELESVKKCEARVITVDQNEGLKDPNEHN